MSLSGVSLVSVNVSLSVVSGPGRASLVVVGSSVGTSPSRIEKQQETPSRLSSLRMICRPRCRSLFLLFWRMFSPCGIHRIFRLFMLMVARVRSLIRLVRVSVLLWRKSRMGTQRRLIWLLRKSLASMKLKRVAPCRKAREK